MFELTTYELAVLSAGAIAFGLYLLIKGGDWTVDAAVFIAERTGLSPLFIGATIISFGTSVPELFTSINANLSGYPGISLGNVLGSNVANILLVLGATAIVFTVSAKKKRHLAKDFGMMLLATAILAYGMITDSFTQVFGLGMFAILATFVWYQYKTDNIPIEDEDDDAMDCRDDLTSIKGALLLLIGGLAALAIGSELLVEGAVQAGTALGVSEAVIGLTVVAFGTSLPELSTCIAAAKKRSVGLIMGNIIGSNTFNIMSIVALTAAVKPLAVDPILLGLELWLTVGISVAFALWMMTVGRITRPVGIAMVAAYVVFVAAQYLLPQMAA